MWQKRESPKGHRHRPLFHEIHYWGRVLFPQLAATGVDGLGTMAMRWREVASTSENSSWNSQMPQLPQHPFERQSRTLAVATHDQVFGGHLDDQQLVFRQV